MKTHLKSFLTILAFVLFDNFISGQIIDMHMHTGPPTTTYTKEQTDKYLDSLIVSMKRNDIAGGFLSGPIEIIKDWRSKEPKKFTYGLMFPCRNGKAPWDGQTCYYGKEFPPIDELEKYIDDGTIGFLGELVSQYYGISPTDRLLDPYFALAERKKIPVCIHMGPGGLPYSDCPYQNCDLNFRASYSNPLLLEDVLVKYPKMKIWIAHAGWPLIDNLLALLSTHQQVYIDISNLVFLTTKEEFNSFLKRIIDAGFEERVLYGSDSGYEDYKTAIGAIRNSLVLTNIQKEKILYKNSKKFLDK